MADTLFDEGSAPDRPGAPLAVRVRPRTIDEVVGQGHLLGEGGPLRRLIDGAGHVSVILWGPPGTGKNHLGQSPITRDQQEIRGIVCCHRWCS